MKVKCYLYNIKLIKEFSFFLCARIPTVSLHWLYFFWCCQIMPIENRMINPKRLRGWFGVINVGVMIVTILYAAVGFFGYWRFGDAILGSVTLNLPLEIWYFIGRTTCVCLNFNTWSFPHLLLYPWPPCTSDTPPQSLFRHNVNDEKITVIKFLRSVIMYIMYK